MFYIPGYDPFPPRRYRELYRRESAAQAAVSGYHIEVMGGIAGEGYGWRTKALIDDIETHSEIEVLVWSDIVQGSQTNSIALVYWQLVKTAWIYLSTGAFFRLMHLRKGPLLAALYPIGMLLAQLGLAVFAFSIASRMIGWALGEMGLSPWPALFIASGSGLLAAILLLRWFQAQDGRFFAYYLMHDFASHAERTWHSLMRL